MMEKVTEPHRPRGYQLEMLEASLKENIIVATKMDTGSGKTHMCVVRSIPRVPWKPNSLQGLVLNHLLTNSSRAVLRIMAELDRCPEEKLVWFLAPTVALCMQQHGVISLQLPAVRTRLLIGSDNVDRWSEQRIWDAALKDIRIIVSTHAVLAEALIHGFVRMTKLALLIFDEAHHCVRGHPANKIMRNFYHPAKLQLGRQHVPHILGLSASPIVRSKPSELSTIETNLDSICRTPRICRQEMLQHVYRPTLTRIQYCSHNPDEDFRSCQPLRKLVFICDTADIEDDPYMRKLRSEPWSQRQVTEVLRTGKTYCQEQLKKLRSKAIHIYEELGSWALSYFIFESVRKMKGVIGTEGDAFYGLVDDEKTYLLGKLSEVAVKVPRTDFTAAELPSVSSKFESLVAFLVEHDSPNFSGLVFVRQRATVSVMSKLLSIHPQTKNRFQCAPFVGMSNSSSRKWNIGELLDAGSQCDTLIDFRDGRKNLIIATDVLEEGIDITACRLVVCYDSPPNLKSFVQRRGRARKMESAFAVFVAEDDTSFSADSWQKLEDEMIRTYQDDSRLLQELSNLENISEDITDKLIVESTGAVLASDEAMGHLHHFCAILPKQTYVDMRPNFAFKEDPVTALVECIVTLPNSVSSYVRQATSCKSWLTEKSAMKDAAFQAYVALHEAGLLNDNLLPLTHERASQADQRDPIPSNMEIQEQFNPWSDFAEAWKSQTLHQSVISVQQNEGEGLEYSMILTTPLAIPEVQPFTLYWDSETTFTVHLEPSNKPIPADSDIVRLSRDITHLILRSTHSDHSSDDRKDFVALFTPDIHESQLDGWLTSFGGRCQALEDFHIDPDKPCRGLLRSNLFYGMPHIFTGWSRSSADSDGEVEVEFECFPLPRRRNFLRSGTFSEQSAGGRGPNSHTEFRKLRKFPAKACTFDRLPFERAQFGLFIPAILQYIEVAMITNCLQQTLLKEVAFGNPQHLVEAICASSSQWVVNYQRYEFLGDTILKFVVSVQLFVENWNWPEGYLSERRSHFISNSRLARAALDTGLNDFILTNSFGLRNWRAPLISESNSPTSMRRHISSKVLADVIEAIIGAAFLDGGLPAARICTHRFLDEVQAGAPSLKSFCSKSRQYNPNTRNTASIVEAEKLIRHSFSDKTLLLEAFSHPSCETDALTESYQRLEFLGDSILDKIVVSTIFELDATLSQGEMNTIKAALVNADLLAFLCMGLSLTQDAVDIHEETPGDFREVHGERTIQLWRFMRHHNQDISKAQQECFGRYQSLHNKINYSMGRDRTYPWAMLTQLNAEKFYSDIIESVFGAIFVDTEGNLADCQQFAERIGIMKYLRRIVADKIDVQHPKSRLEQLTQGRKLEYIVENGTQMHDLYKCTVRLDEVDVVAVGDCLSKQEAVVRTADAAATVISEVEKSAKSMKRKSST